MMCVCVTVQQSTSGVNDSLVHQEGSIKMSALRHVCINVSVSVVYTSRIIE